MLSWGLAWINAKVLSYYLDSFSLIFWRFLIASISLFFVAKALKLSLKIDIKTLLLSFLAALLMLLYNYFFFQGTKFGNAGFGGVLVTTLNPILTFFAIAILTSKNLGKKEYFALFLGALGSFIMLKIWESGTNIFFENGVQYFLLAAFTWVFITLLSSINKQVSTIVFSFYIYLGVIILDYLFFLNEIPLLKGFDSIFWINLLAISFFAVTFATTIYFLATIKLGSKKASAYIFLVPFSAAFFAWIFLDEKLEITTIIGGVIVLLAIYILQDYNWHKRFLKNIKTFLKGKTNEI